MNDSSDHSDPSDLLETIPTTAKIRIVGIEPCSIAWFRYNRCDRLDPCEQLQRLAMEKSLGLLSTTLAIGDEIFYICLARYFDTNSSAMAAWNERVILEANLYTMCSSAFLANKKSGAIAHNKGSQDRCNRWNRARFYPSDPNLCGR